MTAAEICAQRVRAYLTAYAHMTMMDQERLNAVNGVPLLRSDLEAVLAAIERVPDSDEPNGCHYCGVAPREHYERHADTVGWHRWTAPSDARKARMLARRKAAE